MAGAIPTPISWGIGGAPLVRAEGRPGDRRWGALNPRARPCVGRFEEGPSLLPGGDGPGLGRLEGVDGIPPGGIRDRRLAAQHAQRLVASRPAMDCAHAARGPATRSGAVGCDLGLGAGAVLSSRTLRTVQKMSPHMRYIWGSYLPVVCRVAWCWCLEGSPPGVSLPARHNGTVLPGVAPTMGCPRLYAWRVPCR